jgi:DNA-binding HxlR family transcriptional regulator
MSVKRKLTSTNYANLQSIQTICPMQHAMQLIGGRWKILILWYIQLGLGRFSLLRQHIPNISAKMLTQQLRELEADGLVQRSVLSPRPLHVEYSLSAKALSLLPILKSLNSWASQQEELAAREAKGA